MNILEKMDKEYFSKRAKVFRKITKTWKYCKYQGCNECIRMNGLVPLNHEFAGGLGPNSRFKD